ncbi:MAG: TRAP transporter large permease subunit [Bryobacteraceae bacterium]|nr:TRAP transporter large permease subunit [Bryobacteraceae bacterium]
MRAVAEVRRGPRAETWLALLALAMMTVLPLAEILSRWLFGRGVPGAAPIVQHLTLCVAFLGAALAAHADRLLALSTVSFLPSRVRAAVRIATGALTVAVSVALAWASLDVVRAEREAGTMLLPGLPSWPVVAAMPLGFAAVAWRVVRHASPGWLGRLLTALGVPLAALPALIAWEEPARLVTPAVALILAATLLGLPIFAALGGLALVFFWAQGSPPAAVTVEAYRLAASPLLPSIPLFTLGGYLLAEGGASQRLVRVFRALVGWMPGGPAILTTLVFAFFTSFTGASGVTILSLGGLLLPVLLRSRFPENFSLGLVTAAGSIGLLFPPSLPVILYGVYAHTPIDRLFLGGLLPGTLLVAMVALWCMWQGKAGGVERVRFNARELASAVWEAKWELLLPVVVLAGIFGGFATLVEAAALTVLYAFLVEAFLYRDLKLRADVPRIAAECTTLVGGVLLILGVALGFTNYLIDAEVPLRALAWVKTQIASPWLFLLVLNVFLLIVGCLLDIYSAILVVVPLIAPMGRAYGVDPVHLGIIFLANLQLGYLTPPVGMNLFLSAYRFDQPLARVYRYTLPFLIILLLGVLLITYLPWLSLALPRKLGI